MGNTDTGIRIIKLAVKSNEINWDLNEAGLQVDYHKRLDWGSEPFNLNPMHHGVITLLIEELQFLTNRGTISENLQSDANEILRKLVKLLGEHLYIALFNGGLHDCLTKALDDDNVKLLRVELEFADGNSPLASWPWEYLYKPRDKTRDSGVFLAKVTQLVLNRRSSLVTPPRSLTTSKPKLLLVISQPGTLPVQCEGLLKKIQDLEKRKVIELELLTKKKVPESGKMVGPRIEWVTVKRFEEFVQHNPDIIHFIGHGQHKAEGGEVAFELEGGGPNWVRDETFASLVARSKQLKLVFLQACESALPDPYHGVSGMALHLASKNIPAVVAMQYKIENQIADAFACGFYEALAGGDSVDLAVKAGREAIKDNDDYLHYHAFGLPVLYLRSYESIIVHEQSDNPPENPVKCQRDHKLLCETKKICPGCGLRFYCIYCKTKLEDAQEDEVCQNENCGRRVKCKHCKGQLILEQNIPCCMECNRPDMVIPPHFIDRESDVAKIGRETQKEKEAAKSIASLQNNRFNREGQHE